MNNQGKESNGLKDFLDKIGRVVDEHFAKEENDAARELIRDFYHLLPDELQELYDEVVVLYSRGKFEESAKLFDEWMNQARKRGLL